MRPLQAHQPHHLHSEAPSIQPAPSAKDAQLSASADEIVTRPRMSWLCPTPSDRERFLEMQAKLRLARVATILMGTVTAVALVPRFGWPMIAIIAAMTAIALIGGRHVERRRRPELWVFFTAIVNIQLFLGATAVIVGGPRTPVVCMLALPVAIVATRFSSRGLVVGAPLSLLIVLVATVGVDPGYVAGHLESLVVPLALVVCVALYMNPLLSSDVRHRVDSTLDEMTGLLNRRSLEPRMAEIAQQAALTGQPVTFIAADLDHFKRVNDELGHAAGDLVLSEAAAAMRRCLRTFELLYRIGGEEFLLVLPGADEGQAQMIADSLRLAIAATKPAGIRITCSFGVATARGSAVTLEALRSASDEALYAAKRGGRNRVELAPAHAGAFGIRNP